MACRATVGASCDGYVAAMQPPGRDGMGLPVIPWSCEARAQGARAIVGQPRDGGREAAAVTSWRRAHLGRDGMGLHDRRLAS